MESCISALEGMIWKAQMKPLQLPSLRTITYFEIIYCYFCKKMYPKLPDWTGNRKHILLLLSVCKSATIQIQKIELLLQNVGGLAFPVLGVGSFPLR